jgi:hypothetical protein
MAFDVIKASFRCKWFIHDLMVEGLGNYVSKAYCNLLYTKSKIRMFNRDTTLVHMYWFLLTVRSKINGYDLIKVRNSLGQFDTFIYWKLP